MSEEKLDKKTYIGIVKFTLESMLNLSKEDEEYNLQADVAHYYDSTIKAEGIITIDEFFALCIEMGNKVIVLFRIGGIFMNNIHDVKCDIDRLEYYQSKGNEDKVNDYTRLLIEHTKNMVENFQEKEFETKNIITQEVLNKMSDQSAAMLLREILFDKDNVVDWDKAFCLIQKYMPELRIMD